MTTIELMKWYNRTETILKHNNEIILEYKNLAMLFLDDNEMDRRHRERLIEEARKVKAESNQLIKRKEEIRIVLKMLSFVHRQILELYYINNFKTDVCCDILGCTMCQFYSWKEKAIWELERKLNENACGS